MSRTQMKTFGFTTAALLVLVLVSGCSVPQSGQKIGQTPTRSRPTSTISSNDQPGPGSTAGAVLASDWPWYRSMPSLVASSDVVAVGSLTGPQRRTINIALDEMREERPINFDYDVYVLMPRRVLKGSVAAGEVLEIKVGLSDPAPSRHGIYFIDTFGKAIPADLLNPWQGEIATENGRVRTNPRNTIRPKSDSEDKLIAEILECVK